MRAANLRSLLFALTISCASTASFADTADIGAFFNEIGGFGNVTPAQSFQGQTMNTYTGGSATFHIPRRSYQIAAVQAPSLKMGCGGIDAFAGSFSFINSDQLVQMLQNVGNGAVAAIFKLAIDQVSPQLGGVIDYFNKVAQDMNALNINSCQLGSGLVAASGLNADEKKEDNTLKNYSANISNLAGDIFDAGQQISSNISKRQAARDSINSNTDASLESMQTTPRNIVWAGLSRVTKNGMAFDDDTKRLMMGLFGTVVCDNFGSTANPYVCLYKPETVGLKQLMSTGSQTNQIVVPGGGCSGTPPVAGNIAATDAAACVFEYESQINFAPTVNGSTVYNLTDMVNGYLDKVRQTLGNRTKVMVSDASGNMSVDQGQIDELKKGFNLVQSSSLPLWQLVKSASLGQSGDFYITLANKFIAADIMNHLIKSAGAATRIAINSEMMRKDISPGNRDAYLQLLDRINDQVKESNEIFMQSGGDIMSILTIARSAQDTMEMEKNLMIQSLLQVKGKK
ncbi:MAG: conjugal transfer protein TraH [Proteobacteria bacterium]|nr:conjugal transfer protein TraH [Pseudomonadota bacterium]